MLIQTAPPLKVSTFDNRRLITTDSWAFYALGVGRLRVGAPAAILKGWQYAISFQPSAAAAYSEASSAGDAAAAPANPAVLTQYLQPSSLELRQDAVAGQAQDAFRKLTGSVTPLAAAASNAPQLAEPSNGAWEVRALSIHALCLEVMWLHSLTGAPGQVIPYMSHVSDLPVSRPASFAAFMNIARREARGLRPWPAL